MDEVIETYSEILKEYQKDLGGIIAAFMLKDGSVHYIEVVDHPMTSIWILEKIRNRIVTDDNSIEED
jgi:hypothetical protein